MKNRWKTLEGGIFMDKTNKWFIVHENDLEDGTPMAWRTELANGKIIWIEKVKDNEYQINNLDGTNNLSIAMTLQGAKSWVKQNL